MPEIVSGPWPHDIAIGNRGLRIPRVGLGTGLHGMVPEEQSVATIQHALERGVCFLDTAPLYGNGLAEERLGIALRGVPRDSYVLNTKVGIKSGEVSDNFDYDFSGDGIQRCLDRSLRRLGVEWIDILHIHEPEGFATQVQEETLPVLEAWRERGLIRAISAGVNHWGMTEPFVERLDCVLLAGRYTLLEQGALPFLLRQREARRPVLGAGIFNSGILATGAGTDASYNYQAAPEEIQEQVGRLEWVCGQHDVTLSQAAVQFVAAQPAITSLIFGACSPAELDQALQRLELPAPAAFWQQLRGEGLLDPEAPVPAGTHAGQ